MDKQLLIEVLNLNLWEVIDMLLSVNKDIFLNIDIIYKKTLYDTKESLSYFELFNKITSVSIAYILWHSKFQFDMLFYDEEYLQQEIKARKTTAEDLKATALLILDLYKITIPCFNVVQLLHLFKNTLYKSQEFNDLFIERIADYILLLHSQGNLPLEVFRFKDIKILIKYSSGIGFLVLYNTDLCQGSQP